MLGPYPTLVPFLVPVIILEPVKPVGAYLIATGHLVSGVSMIAIGEVLKIVLVERLFHFSRDKLMSIPAIARVYNWAEAWLEYFRHPHVHMIVPGGGISLDGRRWLSCRPSFLLPVPVLSRLFRGRVLQKLRAAHKANQLQFFGRHAHLAKPKAFAAYLAPLRKIEWYLYSKPPFGGPEAVLAYLSRYTHRVAISNRRLIAFNNNGVTFSYKDYRADGRARYKRMTLATDEFIRRFLIHVLPHGFHRIRHYGLFANGNRAANIARARELLAVPSRPKEPATAEATTTDEPRAPPRPCPCCGGRLIIIETFARGCEPKHRPTPAPVTIRIDTS